MKPFMVVREPEAFALLADETRRKILYLLRVKEMTVTQLAGELGLTSQAVYHHIRKLLKGKMVEVAKEERVGHLIESYYIATAEDFILTHGKVSSKTIHDQKTVEEEVRTVLDALSKLGFKLEHDEDKISDIMHLHYQINDCCVNNKKYAAIEEKIWNMDELSLQSKMKVIDFAGILSMSNAEFAEQQTARKKLRDTLLSLIKK